MVHAFIIHTLLPGSSLVLHSSTFRQDPLTSYEIKESGSRWHCVRQAQWQYVADVVHGEYQFRRTVSGRSLDEDLARATNIDNGLGLPELECGVLRLSEHAPYADEKVIVWYGAGTLAFSLVCDKTENRLIAEVILKHIVRYLQEYLLVFSQPSEILNKADCIIQILQQLIPDGLLLFRCQRVMRQLEKELDSSMKQVD
ncbi:uncharacterized protein LOC106867753 [Octopus bimaculoides]|uniref:AP complex mu/sigma subunit domain-containing protein n=1 Tax=Octopus bimaculoides TaxID=37653 RepID=A0A0L8HYW7_OCTBM|nr:uncharacterized protein LOC106867753 [Octopus bimaculoides]|eukprot:XP_014768205.1 PREDICTED: uncharacterized protein LOC106867753 [Octopus bimaculoides]